MTITKPYYRDIKSIAVIGNYVPRCCGIATFTTDLVESLSAEETDIKCGAIVMNDKPEGYRYPTKVRLKLIKQSCEIILLQQSSSISVRWMSFAFSMNMVFSAGLPGATC